MTFYNGGQYVPVASVDRRIRLLDVKSGKCEKTIVEHVGSVKSVCTDEARGFVLSGSYDTTVRYIVNQSIINGVVYLKTYNISLRNVHMIFRIFIFDSDSN